MALLNPEEIAKRVGLSSSQIRRLIREGVIKAEKVGWSYVVNEKDIKNLKRRRRERIFKKKKEINK